jgi:hypothetical protein
VKGGLNILTSQTPFLVGAKTHTQKKEVLLWGLRVGKRGPAWGPQATKKKKKKKKKLNFCLFASCGGHTASELNIRIEIWYII